MNEHCGAFWAVALAVAMGTATGIVVAWRMSR